jgi:integrase/recombinase XerD
VTPHQKRSLSPRVKRLAEDLKIRNRAQATIDAYTFHVGRFETFLRSRSRTLEHATPEDVRAFQLQLLQIQKVGYSSFNQAVCGLRFFYRVTCPRRWPVTMLPFGKRPKTLPVVLSHSEVESLLRCTANLKQRTFLMTLYGSGMRLAEAAQLKIPDIDSSRMQLRIATAKGNKQREVPLSPRLLQQLRVYWKAYRPANYLFPGKTADVPYQPATIQKAIRRSAQLAGIGKPVSPHTLRHSYATGLLEAGVDLLTISRLLGHASFTTTMVYLHVRRTHLHSTPGPLDLLPVRQLPVWQQVDSTPSQSATGPTRSPGPTAAKRPGRN